MNTASATAAIPTTPSTPLCAASHSNLQIDGDGSTGTEKSGCSVLFCSWNTTPSHAVTYNQQIRGQFLLELYPHQFILPSLLITEVRQRLNKPKPEIC